jgi:hypothetical protein
MWKDQLDAEGHNKFCTYIEEKNGSARVPSSGEADVITTTPVFLNRRAAGRYRALVLLKKEFTGPR